MIEKDEYLWMENHYLIMNYVIKNDLRLLEFYKMVIHEEFEPEDTINCFLTGFDNWTLIEGKETKIDKEFFHKLFSIKKYEFSSLEETKQFLIEKFNININTIKKKNVIKFFINNKKSQYVYCWKENII